MQRAFIVALAVVIIIAAGCGGAGVITSVLGLVKVADLVLDIKQLVTPDQEEKLTVLLDGYVVRTDAPNRAGALQLSKLPVGEFLVSLVTADRRNGWHGVVDIQASGQQVQANPFSGPVITGKVLRQTDEAGQVPMARVVVAAFRDGAQRLASGQGPLRPGSLFAGEAGDQMLAMTNEQGEYTLGPAVLGTWLVAVVVPGYFPNAKVVQVQASTDARGVDLVLQPNPAAPPGVVIGSVVADRSGAPLSSALVRADLSTPFIPPVPQATKAAIESATGLTLPASGWFSWHFFAATTDGAGNYVLGAPPGSARVWAYKFGYSGAYRDLSVTAGFLVRSDFRLPPQ
jgi:hypothetical protein